MGQAVYLAVDALPGRVAHGRIRAIAGAPTERKEWGDGRYFEVSIQFEGKAPKGLRPGMSVRVTSTPARATAGEGKAP